MDNKSKAIVKALLIFLVVLAIALFRFAYEYFYLQQLLENN